LLVVVDRLLSPDSLLKVSSILQRAKFIDGRVTAGDAAPAKNNLELELGEGYLKLVEIVDVAIRNSEPVERQLFPRYMTRPIINRYERGMFYREHIDAPIQGLRTQFGRSMAPYGQALVRADFSMTLFLEEPANYDGGELVVDVMGEARPFKLAAGSAVFYPTGARHSVRPVLRGTRTAAILWIQSMVRSSAERRLLMEADELCRVIARAMPGSAESFLANDHYSNLLRQLADV